MALKDLTSFFTSFNPHTVKRDQKFDRKSVGGIRGGSSNKITYIEHKFEEALTFDEANRERMSEAWRLYRGSDDEQWDREIAGKLKEENRNPVQANFIRKKVDGLAGSLLKNGFDVDFKPIDSEYADLTKVLKEMYYSDKELMDWMASYYDLLLDGLVHHGVEELYIDDKYDPLGNIGFRRVQPGHVVFDPNWISRSSKDLRELWKIAYLTVEDLMETYNHKSDEIKALHEARLLNGNDDFDLGEGSKGMPHFDLDERYGDVYRVIEYHHMQREKKKVEVVVATGDIVPEGSDDLKREWAITNGIDLSEGIIEREIQADVYYVTTICPELSQTQLLEDRKGLVQIGRLPFFVWSAARINGQNSGMPGLLKSIQQTYNKRESMLDNIIASSASGAFAIDPEIVDGDISKMKYFEENWTKPNARLWTAEGALTRGQNYFQEIPRSQVDYGIVNEINRLLDMADRITQPAASDGRSQSSEESGILFARKVIQAEIAQSVLMKSLEFFWNEKGEAYFFAAKQLYGNVYREFLQPKENTRFAVNVPVITPEGEQIVNDLSKLPRTKIIVAESPEGVTMRMTERAIYTELLRVLGPDSPNLRILATKKVMQTLDMSTSDMKEIEEAAAIQDQLAKARAETELMQHAFNRAQMQMQMQQMMAPMQMGMMGQQGGQPQEGQPPQAEGNPAATMPGSNANIPQTS